jgi:hypothetical protein
LDLAIRIRSVPERCEDPSRIFLLVGSILAAADDEGDAETMTRARVRVIRLMRTYFERHWGSGSGGRFGMLQWDVRRFCASERSFIAKHAGRKFSAADEAAIRTLI